MLIRVRGYNSGIKEYLEEGIKNGREYTRDELDERVILDGDLDLTDKVYKLITDEGQDRYLSITLSFFEDNISNEKLKEITQEFKEFLMYAYRYDEFNFYAEAHLPKIKQIQDKKTGAIIDRKPHIHVVIPRVNLLSDNRLDPVGAKYRESEKYLEAFQEYINQKYNLVSPRERVRVDPTNVSDILSRYKGDDFRSKNREFKKELVKDIIEKNITDRKSFYAHVSSFGDTRIRNSGKDNEYIAVKLPGDKKYTNLKESIFNDDFIVRRELKKPPLDKNVINERLLEWPQRSKELKYVSKASEAFRQKYKNATPDGKLKLLAERQTVFYQTYGENHGLHPSKRQRDNQRSIVETENGRTTSVTDGMQSLPGSHLATGWDAGNASSTVFLPGDASVYLGQSKSSGRDNGLRHDLSAGRRRGRNSSDNAGRPPSVPGVPSSSSYTRWSGDKYRTGSGRGILAGSVNLPAYASNPYKASTIRDVEQRSNLLLRRCQRSGEWHFGPAMSQWPGGNKNASSVSAWFLRRNEYNQIKPGDKKLLRIIDDQFYTTRRLIYQDERLTRTEKTQYISVLTFERLKARHEIIQPDHPIKEEKTDMGSENIRKLIKEKNNSAKNTIGRETTIDEKEKIPPASRRFSNIVHKLKKQIEGDDKNQERQKSLTAADLYTKRSKLSKNVHYLDKKTDRTLFVDTGSAIAVRREGMSQAALVVALELAKERFGSTLSIKGSDEFKKQIIDVVAKNNMDIHFTDRSMNRQLEERKIELAAEKDGQTIESPDDTGVSYASGKNSAGEKEPQKVDDAPSSKTIVHLEGKLVDHGKAPFENKKGNAESYFVTIRDQKGKETTHWSDDLKDVMKGRRRGQNITLELKESRPVQVNVRDENGQTSVREAVRRTWEITRLPNDMATTAKERNKPAQNMPEKAPATPSEINKSSIPDDGVTKGIKSEQEKKWRQDINKSSGPVAQIISDPVLRNMAMTAEQKSREFNATGDERDSVKEIINTEIADRFPSANKGKEPVELILSDTELRKAAMSMEQKMRELKTPVNKLEVVKAEIDAEIKARIERSRKDISSATASTQEKTDEVKTNIPKPRKESVHVGVLVDSGPAPYKFKPDMTKSPDEHNDSFYVKLKMDNGKTRTLWGVGLESAVRGFQNGDRVKLADKGVEPVTWKETLKDGSVVEKSGDRRIWEGLSLTREAEMMKGFRISNDPGYENDGPGVD